MIAAAAAKNRGSAAAARSRVIDHALALRRTCDVAQRLAAAEVLIGVVGAAGERHEPNADAQPRDDSE
jgi:hypothetical protein